MEYDKILTEYANKLGAEYAKKIDDGVTVFFVKPKWCPVWLYKFIGKNFVNITFKR